MTKGIIIPVLEKYENLLLFNIYNLRKLLGCTLPIELWQIGQELSMKTQSILEDCRVNDNLSFQNVSDYTDNPEHWKGWQIKAFVMKNTKFDEVILCDCDSIFLQNPEIIFSDQNYIRTGSYFFKDWIKHEPFDRSTEFPARKEFIKRLLPEKKLYFPEEWNWIYDIQDTVQPMWYYQESGVVYLNKKIHQDVVETIYDLNNNYEETYKYIYGDKETFWLAFVINNKPFYMNEIHGENYKINVGLPYYTNDSLEVPNSFCHIYNDKFFFSQKGYPIIVNDGKYKMKLSFH